MAGFHIGERYIGDRSPTYFIADIAANHDGSLSRAIDLIHLAAESGADAVKFQHFKAKKIVSDFGFQELGRQLSHQARWAKPVEEVYRDAELPREWNHYLKKAADEASVDFFSAPYDIEAVIELNNLGVPAFKMGSGDINWYDIIVAMASTGKPLFAATGASELTDVIRLVDVVRPFEIPICLMQCNTNYTGDLENFKHINLNVLKSYSLLFPDVVLGLSDHTFGYVTVLGAVALGAKAIEKHFTDDNSRLGPDHAFSMNKHSWYEMVQRTRELELALGSTIKRVSENEKDTLVLQRRCIRAARDLPAGHIISSEDIIPLRPAPINSLEPWEAKKLIGKKLARFYKSGEHFKLEDVLQ